MSEPLVSIALCTYNGEKYLKEQIDSIIAQTYQNLEIVIVDDASADGTLDIIREYAQQDGRIKYFVNTENLGFNQNFQKALTLTTGDYIAISDQDDIWAPDKIALLLDSIGDNWLVFSNSDFVGNPRELLLKNFKLPAGYRGIIFFNYVTGHTVLLNRMLLNYTLPFPPGGYYDWWMGFVASYHGKIGYVNQVLTHYRVHAASVMQKKVNSDKAKLKEYEATTAMLCAFASYPSLEPEDRNFLNQIRNAYELKSSKRVSLALITTIMKHYNQLFPNIKRRKFFSKLNFAFKFAKPV